MGHDLSRMPMISARLNRMFAAWGKAALPRRLVQWRTVLGGTAAAAIASVVILGATILPAKAQFTALYGFGDSYADTGAAPGGAFRLAGVTACINNPSSCRFTGGTNFVETLQSIYGLPGLTNYAIGGARTDNGNTLTGELNVAVPPLAGFPYELARLAYDGVRFKSTDLVTVSIGGNDSSLITHSDVAFATALGLAAAGRAVNGTGVAPLTGTYDGVTYTNVVTHGVQQLVDAGARNIAWLSAGNSKYFPQPEGGALVDPATRDAFAHTYYQQIQLLLQPMALSGVRIFMFNFEILQQRVHDNPGMYGFTSATACEAGPPPSGPPPAGVTTNFAGCFYQNSVHPTAAAMALIGNYMANQIDAPTTVVPQGAITASLATGFVGSVLGRLDASRTPQPFGIGNAMAMAYAGPTKAPAPLKPEDRWSVYSDFSYASGSLDRQFFNAGYDYHAPGGTFGIEYRYDSRWRLGFALGYSQPDVTLGVQNAHDHVKSYQFAGYGSFTDTNWFVETVAAYGRHDFSLDRQGVIDVIHGSTSADTFTTAARAGYLVNAGAVRVGPIAGFSYTHGVIGGYTESGDILLTMMVDRQTFDALTGNAGLQLRLPFVVGTALYSPFINLTAEQDFAGSGRNVITTLVTAPLLPILTPVSANDRTYGRVAAGIGATIAGNVSATLTASTTFARAGGDAFAVSGGIKAAF
jgi:outer membrane lipase/esterase